MQPDVVKDIPVRAPDSGGPAQSNPRLANLPPKPPGGKSKDYTKTQKDKTQPGSWGIIFLAVLVAAILIAGTVWLYKNGAGGS